jgi:SAM-dependent methyltransferase
VLTILTTVLGAIGGAAVGVVLLSARAARHCRKPEDRAGRAVLQRMNISHAEVTAWGLSQVRVGEHFTILDVGCGGGRTIDRLASIAARGKVFGIDYSRESVATARETNKAAVHDGRVDIQLGSVSQLPYADATFDLATAVETHYYWPDLRHDVREVMRVLKPGGVFLIIAETYRGRRNDWLFRPTMTLLLRAAYLTPDEHRRLLVDAGFADVRIALDETKGWIAAVGTRPR